MTRPGRVRPQQSCLLDLIDEAFDRRAWHGTTLLGSVRGVDADLAVWRPSPDRHNIWELVLHAAYWKYAVRRRLTGEKRGAFAVKGSNWFLRPLEGHADAAERRRQWKADVRLLTEEHARLREAVAAVPVTRLDTPMETTREGTQGPPVTRAFLIRGIAAHDLYHTGQIQLLKRLKPQR
jgi:uncharacterized damage-inducible protein DinB